MFPRSQLNHIPPFSMHRDNEAPPAPPSQDIDPSVGPFFHFIDSQARFGPCARSHYWLDVRNPGAVSVAESALAWFGDGNV